MNNPEDRMTEFDSLDLSTETIRELTGDELREVAGGAVGATTDCLTGQWEKLIPTNDCTGNYPSLNAVCG